MNQYTIYCTKSQIKKALEFGAPISTTPTDLINNTWMKVTAEQMIGWLRSKGFRFRITEFKEGTLWKVTHGDWFDFGDDDISPKEATIAVIDAALGYLSNNKK